MTGEAMAQAGRGSPLSRQLLTPPRIGGDGCPAMSLAILPRSRSAALGSDQALDKARLLARAPAPDNLVWQDDHLLFSSGKEILVITDVRDGEARPERILRFDDGVSALASASDGGLAVGLGRSGIAIVGGAHDGKSLTMLGGQPLICPTALCFAGPDILYACQGSARHAPEDWQRDLLERRRSGTVWRIELASGAAECLGEGLGFPNGILLIDGGRRAAIAESWRHRLLAIETARHAAPEILLDDLPGYPGRLCPAGGSGAWLAVFAPRSRQVEVVLREHAFRRGMMRAIAPGYWIAPGLRPLRGARKPGGMAGWARRRSHGLVLRLDADFAPVAALHGRATGRRHGVTSCLEIEGELLVACRGDDLLIAAELPAGRVIHAPYGPWGIDLSCMERS